MSEPSEGAIRAAIFITPLMTDPCEVDRIAAIIQREAVEPALDARVVTSHAHGRSFLSVAMVTEQRDRLADGLRQAKSRLLLAADEVNPGFRNTYKRYARECDEWLKDAGLDA